MELGRSKRRPILGGHGAAKALRNRKLWSIVVQVEIRLHKRFATDQGRSSARLAVDRRSALMPVGFRLIGVANPE